MSMNEPNAPTGEKNLDEPLRAKELMSSRSSVKAMYS